MKILLIRHGDPNYTKDGLTPEGHREAQALAARMVKTPVDEIFVSPLGRAQQTAAYTLEAKGMTAVTYDWLREFDVRLIWRPDVKDHRKIPWDWLPQDWTGDERFYRDDEWFLNERMAEGGIKENYDYVVSGLDALLADHGYVREGRLYRAKKPNTKVLALFCHYGVSCVILSHLMGVSPMTLWHGICMAPTSVTTVVTEERREGIASLRAIAIGDVSHLYAAGLEPSLSARFCECFSHEDERHD